MTTIIFTFICGAMSVGLVWLVMDFKRMRREALTVPVLPVAERFPEYVTTGGECTVIAGEPIGAMESVYVGPDGLAMSSGMGLPVGKATTAAEKRGDWFKMALYGEGQNEQG